MSLKKLNVDLDQVVAAMQRDDGADGACYLDKETGLVVTACDPANPNRFEEIPQRDSHETYHVMEEFVDRVHEPHLHARLEAAISGHAAFRKFMIVLRTHPKAREKWTHFEARHKREWAREFLEDLGIESTWEPMQEAR
jgi:hypothetical protein